MMISVPVRIWSISMVILALCNGLLLQYGCFDEICYEGSFTTMNQDDANKYCQKHSHASGILSLQDYEKLKMVLREGHTWIGIKRVDKGQWKYLSGQSVPVVNSTHRAQEGEVMCAYQHNTTVYSDACHTKKKYVCQNEIVLTFDNFPHHTHLSWFEARNDCIKRGGDLYYPYRDVRKIFGDEQYWIGVKKDNWTWTANRREADVTYWSSTQPHGNGSCVTFTNNGWYLLDCQKNSARALCVRQTGFVIATQSPLVPNASLWPPQNINPLTDSDAFPQSTLQENELPSMHTTHSPKDVDSNNDDENKIKDKAVVNPVSRSDSNSTGKYIGGGVAGAVAVLVIGLGIGFALGRFRKKEKTETQSSQEVSDNHPRDDQYEEINESALEMNEFAQAEACGPKYMNCETTEPGAYSALNDKAEPENPYFPLRKP